EVHAGLGLAGEQARALEHVLDAEIAPRELLRVALGEHLDAIAVHDHRVAVDLHFAGELAMRGVIFREVHVGLGIAKIVERHDLHFAVALRLVKRTQDVAPNAAITVDADLDCHDLYPLSFSSSPIWRAILSVVKPKWGYTSANLPDAPNRSMPITRPSR